MNLLILAFLLLPPVLQLLALFVALKQGIPVRTLIVGSAMLGIALALSGTGFDFSRSDAAPGDAWPVHDWTIGTLLGLAVFIETLIVVTFVKPEHLSERQSMHDTKEEPPPV